MDEGRGNDLSAMLSGAMSDPRFTEILTRLKSGVDSGEIDLEKMKSAALSGDGAELARAAAGKGEEEKKPPATEEVKKEEPRAKSVLSPAELEKHKRLLAALKPYLSEPKKEAVENILKVGQITDIAQLLGLGK